MKRPRAGYVQQISVPLTPLSNLSTLYLLKSLVLMPGARCRKVGPAAERGKAAAFGYKATVLLVSASKRFGVGFDHAKVAPIVESRKLPALCLTTAPRACGTKIR